MARTRHIGHFVAEEVMKTSIPNQLHLLYGLANAMDILRIAIDGELRDMYARHASAHPTQFVNPKGFSEGDLRGFTNYTRAAKAMAIGFEKDMEHMVQAATMDDDGKVNVETYDYFMHDSNWILKLVMYAIDRNLTDQGILEAIKAIPKSGEGLFPDELIERFTLR